MERIDSLDLADRVASLQAVTLFADLEIDDLERIAELVGECRYDAGESIYEEGMPAEEMMVIVDGAAIVLAHEAAPIIRGPGEPIGELALLRRTNRTVDVAAGPDGLHALVFGANTFAAVLEERPAIRIAMLATLAARIAELDAR